MHLPSKRDETQARYRRSPKCRANLAEPHGIVVRLCKWRHRARKTKQFALRLPPHREWLKQATQCQFCVVGAINDGLNDIGRE